MRKVQIKGRVGAQEFDQGIIRFSKNLNETLEEGLRYFGKEVRRRARISLARTAGAYPSGSDTRYGGKRLRDTIEFQVNRTSRLIEFTVGEGLPYAKLHDDPSATRMWGNPVMRFFWYRFNKPVGFRRPAYVTRKGTGFFTKALQTSLRDFDKIFKRFWDRAIKKGL